MPDCDVLCEGEELQPSVPEEGMPGFVTRDPAHWTNRCIADYYGLASIRSSR